MTSSNLEVVITARDEASAKLKDIETASKQIGVAFGAMGAAIDGALILTIKAAEDAQEKMDQFNNMLKNTANGSAPAVSDALKKAADATLALGFDNEDAALSLAKFYSRTNDVTEAQKLNVVAMDLARQKHLDLATATNLVNLVLSGNGRVLKQYGINLKDAATPLEALNELHEKTKGSAETFTQSFVGQQQVMKQSVEELEENIGNVLLPILQSLLSKIVPIINSIKAWTDAHPQLTKMIVLATGALGILFTVIGAVALAVTAITAFFSLAFAPAILAVVAATTLLVAGATAIIAYWSPISAFFKKLWDDVVKTFKSAISGIIGFFQPLLDIVNSIVNAVSKISNGISSVVGKVGGAVSGAISSAGNFITSHLASGGNVSAGSTYLVGENGPELFSSETSGRITPNNALGGSGSIVVNINGGTYDYKEFPKGC